ncbi:MFS transporter [Streptomyces sp. LX-29]|uniref:MFS transporter n=1 Tax=Streptomyces sp. LX-29 TaxID=2900152 RepID=UPI00240CED1A|nr:MFS transporter [Streptomyces sp. LX-29]WFB10860.1 MFS transporter [Streptomyces sp. LX-29]
MTVKQRWVLVLTSLASLITALDALVVTTALPAIRLDLDASVEELEWTVNAYLLPFAVLLMAGAALGDRYGRKRVFTGGLIVFTLASVGCALAPGIGWLIAARAVQGVGAAAVVSVAQAHLSVAFSAEERPKAMGLFGAVTGLATLGGPVVGGVLVESAAWEWIFWINVPIGVVMIPLIITKLSESVGEARQLDFGGIGLATVAAFGVGWSLVRGNAAGWGSVEVVGGFVAGAAALAGFVWWELRTPQPLMPIHFFRSRAFSAGNAAMFLLFGSAMAGLFFYAQFLQTVLEYGPLDAGLRLVPWTVTVFFFSPIAGKLVGRIGERPLITAGLLLQAFASGWLALIVEPDMAYSEMVGPFVIGGIGISIAVPAVMTAVFGAVPDEGSGAASGTLNSLRQLGGAFGIAIATAVFAAVGGYGSLEEFNDGFSAAIITAAVVALIGVPIGLAIPARRDVPAPEKAAVTPDKSAVE